MLILGLQQNGVQTSSSSEGGKKLRLSTSVYRSTMQIASKTKFLYGGLINKSSFANFVIAKIHHVHLQDVRFKTYIEQI